MRILIEALATLVPYSGLSAGAVFWGHRLALLGTGILVTALLLGLSYTRVRYSKPGLLPLIWGYSLASAALATPIYLIGATLSLTLEDPSALRASLWFVATSLTYFVLVFPVFLWFARQASRFSLAHAFFLAMLLPLPAFTWGGLGVLSFVSIGVSLAIALLAVWLLGNFESRGQAFRRRAVVAMLMLNGSSQFVRWPLPIAASEGTLSIDIPYTVAFFIGGFTLATILPLALVYLVRVRQPAAEARLVTDAPTAPRSEGP